MAQTDRTPTRHARTTGLGTPERVADRSGGRFLGVSVTTRLAPRAFAGQLLGLWFLAVAVGDAAGGQAVKLQPVLGDPAYFTGLGLLAVLVGIALAASARRLTRLTGGV